MNGIFVTGGGARLSSLLCFALMVCVVGHRSFAAEPSDVFAAALAGELTQAVELLDALRLKEPNRPELPDAILAVARALADHGQGEQAEGLWLDLARNASFPTKASEARLTLLRHYWKHDRYDDFLHVTETLPELEPGYDGGEAKLRSGYIVVRFQQDLPKARSMFAEAASLEGERAEEAVCAVRWVDIMSAAEDSAISEAETKESFRRFIVETQGGARKLINIHDVGRRTVKYAELVSAAKPDAALKLCRGIAADPIFGQYRAEAALLAARLEGTNVAQVENAHNREQAALQLMKSALAKNRTEEFEAALGYLDTLLAEYPDTALARDAYLRRGYILLNGERFEEAAHAFEEALAANEDLGTSHPLNLEAKARLRYLKQAGLYTMAGDFRATVQDVLEQDSEWLESLPDKSPDIPIALLQAAGVQFEALQRDVSDSKIVSSAAWEQFREVLGSARAHPDANQDVRARLDLMMVESFVWSENATKSIESGLIFLETYSLDEYRREYLTVCYFLTKQYQRLQRYEDALTYGLFFLSELKDTDALWPQMDHIERAYLYCFEAHAYLGQWHVALAIQNELANRFPDSQYLSHIQSNIDSGIYQ